ncbi:MAG: hypothetical protein C5B56_02950 [Proteobacteria bacterium]|nr:MAG: hypothetical protein C5B56_02950 [Pseudomonadota bacterium]
MLVDSKHWLDRAEEARLLAESMHDAGARLAMLTTAMGYERLAEHAERHFAGVPATGGVSPTPAPPPTAGDVVCRPTG